MLGAVSGPANKADSWRVSAVTRVVSVGSSDLQGYRRPRWIGFSFFVTQQHTQEPENSLRIRTILKIFLCEVRL